MLYFMHSDSIKNIGLSVRSHNALHRAGVRTVGAMLALDRAQMSNIRNLGIKSIDEIEKKQNEIKVSSFGPDYAGSTDIIQAKLAEETPLFFDAQGTQRRDIPLYKLNLSYRANRILARAGYDFASKLIDVTAEQLLALPHMGKSSVEEVLSKVAGIEFAEVKQKSEKYKQAEKDCLEFVTSFFRHIPAFAEKLYEALLPYYENAYENDASVNSDALFAAPVLRDFVEEKIIAALEGSYFGANMEDLFSLFPDSFVSPNTMNTILHELSAEGKIRVGRSIEICRPSLWEYVDSISNNKQGEMLKLRLQGKTLEEIGKTHGGLTRERARQVIKKCIDRKQVIIEEDKYRKIYETYSFSKEEFLSAFSVDDSVYIYMTLICDKAGELPLKQFLEDSDYPVELRKSAERVVYKNYFTIGSTRVLKRRTELAYYVVRTYFQDEAEFDAFVEKYNTVLQELGIADDSRFTLNKATYQNRFAESKNVLWKYQNRFRYYDMSGRDFTALLEGLNLKQYTNVEFSSLKFFRSYPELMEEYDIRDEYELHNLLKKLYAKKGTNSISFFRMPIIGFGKVDRDNQVLDLLIHLAPIGVKEFCAAYEAEYGVLARTVAGSFISCIDEYKDYAGMYDISAEPLPANQMKKMREILQDDYYDISYILQLYCREFPSANPNMINSYTLKSMGFKVFSSYVIKDSFSNATEYFRYILTAKDFIDVRNFPATLTSQTTYTSELYNLKTRYEIIEFEPLRYINRRKLESLGVTTHDIKDYCDKVSEFVQPMTYFTIHSLRRQGFTHSLDDLDFDEWFYASILTEDKARYNYQHMGGTRVFCQSSEQVTMEGLFKFIIERSGSIDFKDFIELLKEEYNVIIDRYKILEVIYSSPMYYDRVAKRVYQSNAAADSFIGDDAQKEGLAQRSMLTDDVEQCVIDFFYDEKADEEE